MRWRFWERLAEIKPPHDHSIRELKDLIRERECVLMLGAGVTAGLTQDSRYMLKGFREDAIALVNGENARLKPKKGAKQLSLKPNASIDEIVSTLRKAKLFDDFFDQRFSRLRIDRSKAAYAFLEALLEFQTPIFTTNYDDIIERETGFRTLTLQNSHTVWHTMNERNGACVIHMHGVFHSPETITLDREGYESLKQGQPWKSLQQYLVGKHVLFVGFNESMRDPAFTSMRAELASGGSGIGLRDWLWLRPESERGGATDNLPLQFFFDSTVDGRETILGHTRRLTAALNEISSARTQHPLKKIPIIYPNSAERAHRHALIGANRIRMAAHRGTWLRNELLPALKRRHASSSLPGIDLTVVLLKPSEQNFRRYTEYARGRGPGQNESTSLAQFEHDIALTIAALRELNPVLCRVRLALSPCFFYFRTTIVDDKIAFVSTALDEPNIQLRGDLMGLPDHDELERRGIDEYSAISAESFFYTQFVRAFEFQADLSDPVDLTKPFPAVEALPEPAPDAARPYSELGRPHLNAQLRLLS